MKASVCMSILVVFLCVSGIACSQNGTRPEVKARPEARATLPPIDPETAAWNTLSGSTASYKEFHTAYPNSKRLSVVRADVDCTYSITMSLGSYGSGSASGGPLNITVSGHPEFSGDYQVESAAALGLGAEKTPDGTVQLNGSSFKNVELLVAQREGKPKIVAAIIPAQR